MDGVQPAGLPGHLVQGPEHRGARPRLPVADPQGGPAQGRGRHLQSIALRGCPRRAGPRPRPDARSGRSATTQINAFERHLADNGTTHRQVLPVDRPRRAARAVPGPLRRPDQALEVLDGRPRRARALGRLPGGLRRGADEDVDRRRAVVRHPGRPQVVPQPRRGDDPGRHDGRPEAALPAGRRGRARRTSSST